MHELITKQEAVARGMKRYFTGSECLNGHVAWRSLSGNCMECLRFIAAKRRREKPDARRQYYWRNKSKENERSRQYSKKHKSRISESGKEYRRKNAERLRAATAAWRATHPQYGAAHREANRGRYRAYVQNRMNLQRGGKISNDLAERLYELQKGKCACCGIDLDDDFSIDHIIPLSKGGKHEDANIQLLKLKCNLRKGSQLPHEYMQSLGNLL